jgi:hypothetical protein
LHAEGGAKEELTTQHLNLATCQTWMVVLLATIREIHETQQIHEINENPDWQVHEIHEIQRQKKGKKPLLLNSYSSHLFRPFSYAGAQHGVNLCESAPLGGIHLVSISKNPPWYLSTISYIHSLGLKNFPSGL